MYTNRIKKSLTKLLGIVALLALSLPGYANIDSVKASQLNLDLETGSTAFGIKGEGLIPLYLKPNKAIYTDLEGSYDTKSKGYSIELGGGYRQIEDINARKTTAVNDFPNLKHLGHYLKVLHKREYRNYHKPNRLELENELNEWKCKH